jgi:hypothetical protein
MCHELVSTGMKTQGDIVYTCTEHFEKAKLGVRLLPAITSPHTVIRSGEEPGAGQNTARATSSLRTPPLRLRIVRVRTRRMSTESESKFANPSLITSRNNGIGAPSANDNCPK